MGIVIGSYKKATFDVTLLGLQRYKELHGTLHIPQNFIIPQNDSWPIESHGLKLGNLLYNIVVFDRFQDHRDTLKKLGVPYESTVCLRLQSVSLQSLLL